MEWPMLVLTCAVFLLVVMPAALLWLGRMIEANTDGRQLVALERSRKSADTARTQRQGAGDGPWYRRPMQPAFSKARRTT